MQKITPFLWFDDEAEEAAKFYTSIFKNSKIEEVSRYGEEAAAASGKPVGTVMLVAFQLEGQKFIALNGGPVFDFTPALSLVVNCQTQDEVDTLWKKLSAGGKKCQCAWLTDKFGVSWQIVPITLSELLNDPDPVKSKRVMAALLKMTKINIAKLKRAYNG